MVTKSREGHDISGKTVNRPTNLEPGEMFYDTDLDCLCVCDSGGSVVPVSGQTPVSTVAAAGTNQSTAAAVTAGGLTLVTAADGTKGVKLPATVKDDVVIFNSSTSPLLIYPGTSGTINGGTANAAVVLRANSVATFYANGTNAWSSLLNSQLAARTLGGSTAAAGTTTSDAGALPAGTAEVYPTSGADGTKGVKINAADNVAGRMIMVGNGVSNAVLKIYPPTGGTINGAAADAAFSTVSGKGGILYCSAAGTWLAW